MAKSLAELLAEISASGWLVNNLFQLHDGTWRANLRFTGEDRQGARTYAHEYADAASPEEALTAAIWNSQQKRYDATRGTSILSASTRLAMRKNEVARKHLAVALARGSVE